MFFFIVLDPGPLTSGNVMSVTVVLPTCVSVRTAMSVPSMKLL